MIKKERVSDKSAGIEISWINAVEITIIIIIWSIIYVSGIRTSPPPPPPTNKERERERVREGEREGSNSKTLFYKDWRERRELVVGGGGGI